jgi:dTDP-glucose 4,6-dehydratase
MRCLLTSIWWLHCAESHVDRSITDPLALWKRMLLVWWICWMQPKPFGKIAWKASDFITSVPMKCMEVWVPKDCLQRLRLTLTPYSASKASSDHFVRAYGETYGLPYVLTNCSNNYGPFFTFNWFRCLLIILFKINLYRLWYGKYTRDWLFVEDHAVAIDLVFTKEKPHTYNIGGFNEWEHWFS